MRSRGRAPTSPQSLPIAGHFAGLVQRNRTLPGQEHGLIPACYRVHSENIACLIERVDTVFYIPAENYCLVLWIRRSAIRPREFEIGMPHPGLDDPVNKPLDPTEQRSQALFEGRFLSSLRRRSIDLRGKGGGRQRKCIADDPCQPLVEIVLVRRLLKGLIFGSTGSPDEAGTIACIAGQDRVEPLLELADLLGAPPIRCIE